jgi:predicted acylesterase/phospholipase RssA
MGADRVLAVHLKGTWGNGGAPRHLFDVIGQSFAIAQDAMSRLWREAADLVIEPDVAGFAYDDFKRADELIRVGEAAMRQALPAVRKWLAMPDEEPVSAKAVGANGSAAVARPAPMPAD